MDTIARHALREKGIKLVWVAQRTGIHRDRLRRIIDADFPFRLHEAVALSPILFVPVETLMHQHEGRTAVRAVA